MSQDTYRLSYKPGAASMAALGAGVLGAVGCVASFFMNRQDFFVSYLTAFSFFLAITLGSFFFMFVQYLARSAWSVTVRRISETIASNFWVMALLFIPVLLGAHDLLVWTRPEVRATDALVKAKAAFLNEPFLYFRVALIFGLWSFLGWYFFKKSTAQDTSKDPLVTNHLGRVAAGAAVIFALSQTIYALDWIMSLDPHWFSTMFGVYYFAGAVVAQYAFLILMTTLFRSATGRKDIYRGEHYHDMGKLLFGHNVFWTYIGFSQFMLIWYANIPEETLFFHHRAVGSWKTISLMLPWCHFAIPFLYLMSWHVKRNIVAICVGCVWMLAICYIDIYWLIQPNFHHHGAHFWLGDASAILMVGGIFLYCLLNKIKKVNLIPSGDPRLKDCLTYDNGVVTNELN